MAPGVRAPSGTDTRRWRTVALIYPLFHVSTFCCFPITLHAFGAMYNTLSDNKLDPFNAQQGTRAAAGPSQFAGCYLSSPPYATPNPRLSLLISSKVTKRRRNQQRPPLRRPNQSTGPQRLQLKNLGSCQGARDPGPLTSPSPMLRPCWYYRTPNDSAARLAGGEKGRAGRKSPWVLFGVPAAIIAVMYEALASHGRYQLTLGDLF